MSAAAAALAVDSVAGSSNIIAIAPPPYNVMTAASEVAPHNKCLHKEPHGQVTRHEATSHLLPLLVLVLLLLKAALSCPCLCAGPASVDGPPVLLNAVPAHSDHVLQAGANDDTVVVVVHLSSL